MHILVLSINYFPEKTGIAVTKTAFCEWFAKQGHKVEVVTAFPYYPEWKITDKFKGKFWIDEKINNVSLFRTWFYVPKNPTSLKRIFHELSFCMLSFMRMLQRDKPDILVVVSPPLLLGSVGLLYKFIKRIPIIFNVEDLQPDAAFELGMLKNPFLLKILHILEKKIYKRSDKIATLGYGVIKRIIKKDISQEKLIYLPTTADPELVEAEFKKKSKNKFLTHNKIKDKFIVLHSGNMGIKQGMDIILDTAKELKKYPITFFLVGDGAARRHLEERVNSEKIENIKFLLLQPREWLADMYHAADICLLTQRKEVIDIVVPSKLISMMAAGSCIVASAHLQSEAAAIINKAECGAVITPEKPREFAKAILKYYNDYKLIKKCRIKSKKYILEHFERNKIMKCFEKELIKINKF